MEKAMVNKIQISPEVVRLAQIKARATGTPLASELARSIVEAAIVELDPELNLMLETDKSVCNIDSLAHAVGVNDVFVNGCHIDIRYLHADGRVAISRALIGTPYLSCGSFVVQVEDAQIGTIVGYVGPGTWMAAEEQFAKEGTVYINANAQSDFDFLKTLLEVCNKPKVSLAVSEKSLPTQAEMSTFIANHNQYIVARQKQIMTAIMSHSSTLDLASNTPHPITSSKVSLILADSSLWSKRVETFVDRVSSQFTTLSKDEIRTQVRTAGERFGGQPGAPLFRKAVVETLMREELKRKLHGKSLSKVASVVDQVLAGRSTVDSVKDFVKNRVAVDLALTIKRQRQKAEGVVAATAEEIGMAFQQLALQPAYATHSQDPSSGIESINEALELLEAGDLAEQALSLENELAMR
jgi:hypothetical protein